MRQMAISVLLTSIIFCSLINLTMAQNLLSESTLIYAPVQRGPDREGEEVSAYNLRRLFIKLNTNAVKWARAEGGSHIGIASLDAIGHELKVKSIQGAYGHVKNSTIANLLKMSQQPACYSRWCGFALRGA